MKQLIACLKAPFQVVQVLWYLRPTVADILDHLLRFKARLHKPTWYEL